MAPARGSRDRRPTGAARGRRTRRRKALAALHARPSASGGGRATARAPSASKRSPGSQRTLQFDGLGAAGQVERHRRSAADPGDSERVAVRGDPPISGAETERTPSATSRAGSGYGEGPPAAPTQDHAEDRGVRADAPAPASRRPPAVKPGLRASPRSEYRTSWSRVLIGTSAVFRRESSRRASIGRIRAASFGPQRRRGIDSDRASRGKDAGSRRHREQENGGGEVGLRVAGRDAEERGSQQAREGGGESQTRGDPEEGQSQSPSGDAPGRTVPPATPREPGGSRWGGAPARPSAPESRRGRRPPGSPPPGRTDRTGER